VNQRRRNRPLAQLEIPKQSEVRMPNDPQANKENAIAFYNMMFNKCEPRAAIEQYAGDDYIQHNPHVADGKEAFIDYFERMACLMKIQAFVRNKSHRSAF
jgi:hypothetical protein